MKQSENSLFAQRYEIDWRSVRVDVWIELETKYKKQAEFLLEGLFPWGLVECIGVYSGRDRQWVAQILDISSSHKPLVFVHEDWCYEPWRRGR